MLSVTTHGHVEDVVAEAKALGAVAVDIEALPLKDMFLELVATED